MRLTDSQVIMGSSPIGIANTVSTLYDASNHVIEITVSFLCMRKTFFVMVKMEISPNTILNGQ